METRKMGHSDGVYVQRFVPARVVFVCMGFIGFCLVYAYKVVLSMSIVSMVNSTSTESNESESNCPVYNATAEETTPSGDLDWDSSTQGFVLGAFFYGYVATQIPAGIMANKVGGKWIFGVSILIAALLSIAEPFAAKCSSTLFIVARVIQGLVEGVVFPCMNTMIAHWMPIMERTRGVTIIYTGSMIGTVVTLPVAAMLNKSSWGWPSTFYILGIVGIVWFILYTVLVYESPEFHPHISSKERQFILENGGGKQEHKKITTSIPVYALTFTNFGQNWGFLTVLSLMPTYMDKVLHTNINQNILISGMPYLGQAVFGWIVSYATDRVRESGRLHITTIRKINSCLAYIPAAICMALVPTVGCDQTLSCLLIILAMTANGAVFSGCNSTHVDMAPDFAGVLMGVTNGIGNIPGFLAPSIAAMFYSKGQTVDNWAWVFYISAIVFLITAVVYVVYATCEEQTWGRIKEKEKVIENSTRL